MKQDLLNEIIKEKHKNIEIETQRVETLFAFAMTNSDFEKLENEQRSITIEIGKLAFLNKSTINLENKLKNIKKNKETVLKQMNLNVKDFQTKAKCARCKDTCFIDGQLCSCVKKEYSKQILNLSNINLNDYPTLNSYCFDVFDAKNKENMQKIINILQKWIISYQNITTPNVMFCGNSGTGKTFLSLCVAKEIQKLDKIINFTTSFNLNAEFLKSHLAPISNKNNVLNEFLLCDFLVIDDLGTEPFYKNVTSEYLFLLINERQENNLPTIITTNLSPNEILDRYGERVFSRLFNKQKSLTFNLTNADLRLK